MACIIINLGQCGIQIGHNLIENLYNNATSEVKDAHLKKDKQIFTNETLNTFFNENSNGKYEARCVMIDMEPKAVGKALKEQKKNQWNYSPDQQFYYNSGSGNNWAFGYNVLGPKFKDMIANKIRKEVEKCDSLDGFVVMMSIAGGTGSGVGSYYLNELRENYSRATIINPYVLPYSQGEVAVQYYNSILSLANMSCSSDVCLSLHNNYLHEVCSKDFFIKNVSFSHMNALASRDLSSVLLPSFKDNGLSYAKYSKNILKDLTLATTGGSSYKILDLMALPNMPDASIPFTTFSWNEIGNGVQKHLRRISFHDNPDKRRFFKNLFIMRGFEADKYNISQNLNLPISWFPTFTMLEDNINFWRCNLPLGKYEKSLTALTNGISSVKAFTTISSKAWNLFLSKSYLHQYYKHGLEQSDFESSILSVQGIISLYNSL